MRRDVPRHADLVAPRSVVRAARAARVQPAAGSLRVLKPGSPFVTAVWLPLPPQKVDLFGSSLARASWRWSAPCASPAVCRCPARPAADQFLQSGRRGPRRPARPPRIGKIKKRKMSADGKMKTTMDFRHRINKTPSKVSCFCWKYPDQKHLRALKQFFLDCMRRVAEKLKLRQM